MPWRKLKWRSLRDKNAALGEINISDVAYPQIQEISRVPQFPPHQPVTNARVHRVEQIERPGRDIRQGSAAQFRDGAGELYHHGKRYTMPVVMCNGISQLYLIYFYFPKFFDLPAMEKLRVVFHELYHINRSSTATYAGWEGSGNRTDRRAKI